MELHPESSGDWQQHFENLFQYARSNSTEFGHLLEKCRPWLRLMARQLLVNEVRLREDESDIVQQTIIEALQDFPDFQGSTTHEFLVWLKQLHRHNIQNLVRFHRADKRDFQREVHLQQTTESDVSLSWYVSAGKNTSPEIALLGIERALYLSTTLQQLPEDQRIAITMRHIDGANLAEICSVMDKTPASVAGLLRRGLQNLRDLMSNESSWF